MNVNTKKLLLQQGYSNEAVCSCSNINRLARWTPITCATAGIAGLIIQQPLYFLVLGLLTTIGAFSKSSFFDYIYNYGGRFIFGTEKAPAHGVQRQFGCFVGSLMYLLGALGLYLNDFVLTYVPTIFIVTFALLAAVTQWCFASAIYNYIFTTKKQNV
jgi:hypothetical protein